MGKLERNCGDAHNLLQVGTIILTHDLDNGRRVEHYALIHHALLEVDHIFAEYKIRSEEELTVTKTSY
jgi:hypothetical protein